MGTRRGFCTRRGKSVPGLTVFRTFTRERRRFLSGSSPGGAEQPMQPRQRIAGAQIYRNGGLHLQRLARGQIRDGQNSDNILLACWIAARARTDLDPVFALRAE